MRQPTQSTAAACSSETCVGCEIEGKLLCVHTPKDLMDFAVLSIGWLIPFIAGMAIGGFWIALGMWLLLAAIFFIYVEALILCRHCPHYAEDGFTLKCHANWGLPKIPGFNPYPANKAEKVIWLLYVAVLFLFYIPFFVISQQWLLLAITSWALLAWAWTVLRTQCTRCYNLSCPVNRVPDDVKERFFSHYPEFAKAWGKQSTIPHSQSSTSSYTG